MGKKAPHSTVSGKPSVQSPKKGLTLTEGPSSANMRAMISTRIAVIILASFLLLGCPNRDIIPLIGEEPEVLALLEQGPVDEPTSSAEVAARRLHQALVQGDTEFAWSLLAPTTQQLMEAQGARMGSNGREALASSTLPSETGTIRNVNFNDIFYGPNLVSLEPGPVVPGTPEIHIVYAKDTEGRVRELRFINTEGLWRLVRTEL
jgi:hypothetical protein